MTVTTAPKVTFKRTDDPSTTDCLVKGQEFSFQIEKNERTTTGFWDAYSVRMGGKQNYFSSMKAAKAGVVAYVTTKHEAQV